MGDGAAETAGPRSTLSDLFLGIFHEVHSIPGADPQELRASTRPSRSPGSPRSCGPGRRRSRSSASGTKLPANLRTFGVNLNLLAPGKGRSPDHRTGPGDRPVLEYLCHKDRSNSVMDLGTRGSGRPPVVEGLAMRLEYEAAPGAGAAPGAHVVNLQMNTVVAGTVFRGMFEDRIEKVIAEVKERKNLILFIDEAHTLVGAGSAMGVPSDAGEHLQVGPGPRRGPDDRRHDGHGVQRRSSRRTRRSPGGFRVVKDRGARPSRGAGRSSWASKPRLEANYGVEILDEAIDFRPLHVRPVRPVFPCVCPTR